MDEKNGKLAAIRELLAEVKGWKKDSLRERGGKQEVEVEDGVETVEEPKAESDQEHDILRRLADLLGK